jgi:hypothetical protein
MFADILPGFTKLMFREVKNKSKADANKELMTIT